MHSTIAARSSAPDGVRRLALHQHTKAHLSHQHCLVNHVCELDGETAQRPLQVDPGRLHAWKRISASDAPT